MKDQMIEGFRKIYGGDGGIKVYFAPGRVNLIGEHRCEGSVGAWSGV